MAKITKIRTDAIQIDFQNVPKWHAWNYKELLPEPKIETLCDIHLTSVINAWKLV